MKKLLVIAAVALASVTASAQVYLGGSLGVDYTKADKKTTFTLAPEVGGSLSENWAIGAALNYTLQHQTGTNTNAFTVNPYVRYTFARVADDKLGFFVDGGFGLGFGKEKGQSKTDFVWNIGFKPGISYTFNEHWSVVAHLGWLGYQGVKTYGGAFNDEDGKAMFEEGFGLDWSSMNLNFGLYYTF